MRLDRFKNPDGKGKYALLNLRTNQVQWGNESPGDQFFVLKYKDKFTSIALQAYADAVISEALKTKDEELHEFGVDVAHEAQAAREAGVKNPD